MGLGARLRRGHLSLASQHSLSAAASDNAAVNNASLKSHREGLAASQDVKGDVLCLKSKLLLACIALSCRVRCTNTHQLQRNVIQKANGKSPQGYADKQ